MKDAEPCLRDEDLDAGAEAMELLLDLSQELRGNDYFRSEDPIEAARVAVSDEVALLWSQVLDTVAASLSLFDLARPSSSAVGSANKSRM